MGVKRCIGFGEHEGTCFYSAVGYAGLEGPPLWCERCETLRRATIKAQLKEISASFEGSRKAGV